MKKTLTLFLIFAFALAIATPTFAEDSTNTADSEVTAEELEIPEPNAFSWLNRWGRNVRIFFTLDPLKKSELELKNAAEDLYSAKIKATQKLDEEEIQELIEKAQAKYEAKMAKIQARLEASQDEYEDTEKWQKFMDKYTEQQLNHAEVMQNIADRITNKVSGQVLERIQNQRQEHLDKFGQTMTRLQNTHQVRNAFKEMFKNANMAEIKKLNRVEILEELEDVAPEIKDEINKFKNEHQDEINELRYNRDEIRQNWVDFAETTLQKLEEVDVPQLIEDEDTEALHELRNEIKTDAQEIRDENKELQQENQDIKTEVKPGIKSRIRGWFDGK